MRDGRYHLDGFLGELVDGSAMLTADPHGGLEMFVLVVAGSSVELGQHHRHVDPAERRPQV